MSTAVGMRGEFDCASCSSFAKLFRGWCPFVDDPKDGEMSWEIDATGDDAHDVIKACPKGVQLREPIGAREVELFHKIEAMGGPLAWYPAPLSMQDSLTTDTYHLLKAIKSRFGSMVLRVQVSLNAQSRPAEPRAQRAS